jgi:hypothetical protein
MVPEASAITLVTMVLPPLVLRLRVSQIVPMMVVSSPYSKRLIGLSVR